MTRLEYERLRHGWNQTELAYLVHTTQAVVSLCESRRMRLTPKLAQRLAGPLGVDPGCLLDEIPDVV